MRKIYTLILVIFALSACSTDGCDYCHKVIDIDTERDERGNKYWYYTTLNDCENRERVFEMQEEEQRWYIGECLPNGAYNFE